MNINKFIKDIKSVNIRSVHIKRRLLMSPATLGTFQSFLEDYIGNEVLIISTSIGMEIYYYSTDDFSSFIKENALLYIFDHIDASKLKFRNSIQSEEVERNFKEAILTFAQYPQLFLVYAKKFIRLREQSTKSRFVMPILSTFFDDTMKLLAASGNLPHYDKIQKVKIKSQKSDHNQKVIKELISEILLRQHRN